MNPTQPQGMSLSGLSATELNALLAQATTQLANVNAQVTAAPVLAKQQLTQRIAGLENQVKNVQGQIDTINQAITALSA